MNITPLETTENKQQREQEQTGPTSLSGAGSQQQEEKTLSQATAELPAAHEGLQEPVAAAAAATAAEDTNTEKGKEAPATSGRTKAAPKRRSGRAANRRWVRDEMSKLRTLLRCNICEEVLSWMGDQVVDVAASLLMLEGLTGAPMTEWW